MDKMEFFHPYFRGVLGPYYFTRKSEIHGQVIQPPWSPFFILNKRWSSQPLSSVQPEVDWW